LVKRERTYGPLFFFVRCCAAACDRPALQLCFIKTVTENYGWGGAGSLLVLRGRRLSMTARRFGITARLD
jgi:hypothetical protein